jgi:hypothetical protein
MQSFVEPLSPGFQSLLRDFGIEDVRITLFTDATAAAAIVKRKGLGRLRHLDVRDLWIQEKVASKSIKVERVRGDENPADPLTKFVGGRQAFGVLSQVNFSLADGTLLQAPTSMEDLYLQADTSPEDLPEEGEACTWEAYIFNCTENDLCFKGSHMSPNVSTPSLPILVEVEVLGLVSSVSDALDPSVEVDSVLDSSPSVEVDSILGPRFCVDHLDVFGTPHVRPLAHRWADMCEESDARFASDLLCGTFPSDIREVYCRRGGV